MLRLIACLLCSLFTATLTPAEFLTDDERQELIAKLTEIQDSANKRVDARFRAAIRAYRQAMSSNEAVIDFYLKCVEKVRFTDQLKDNRDFRDWKDKNDNNLGDPSFRLALRYQLRWLILTLEAASTGADEAALAVEASSFVDTIFADITKVEDQSSVLKQSVMSTVFAKAYEINKVDSEWPDSPIAVSEIYDQVIMPHLRTPTRLNSLRAAWIKRIDLEEKNTLDWVTLKTEFVKGGRRDREREREAREELRDKRTVNEERFATETRPELIWQMEVDLFNSGDEAGAATRMLNHISKNITHSSSTRWLEKLQGLLSPEETEETEALLPGT